MVFKDELDGNLFELFRKEFYDIKNPYKDWCEFIKHKDIGIEYDYTHHHYDRYHIIDERKWSLTRLKYGI